MDRTGKLVLITMLLIFASSAFAAGQVDSTTVGEMASNMYGNFQNIFDLVSGFSYVAGAVFGFKAAIQLKDHTYNPQQNKLSKPATSLVVSSFLLTLPSVIDTLLTSFLTSSYVTVANQYGASAPGAATDLAGMAVAFSHSLPAIMSLVAIGAKLGGFMLLLKCIFMLPQHEQGREPASKIIWTAISAVGLIAFPSMFQSMLETMGGANAASGASSSNPLTGKYAAVDNADFNGAIAAILMFVQLLGAIAFVRGMLIFKAIGENKDGATGRAVTHIFGGAAAMNITWAVAVLAKTIGASAQICGIAQGVICAF